MWLKYYLFFILTILFLSVSGQELSTKIKRKTPEPGTKLSPLCKLITKQANIAMEGNPDSVMIDHMWLGRLTTFEAYKRIDTVTEKTHRNLYIYLPKAVKKTKKLPVLIFYHGGGFIWGNVNTYDIVNHKICRETQCIVVFVEYRKAGEAPHPAAMNDCYETLEWVYNHIEDFGGDKTRIGLIGDSAGGNLSLVTAINSLEKDGPKISLEVLYYPSTITTDTMTLSRQYFMGNYGPHYILSEDLLRRIKDLYLAGYPDTSKYVSPLLANFSKDMPSTLIITAQCDPLRDEGEMAAKKLHDAGVPVIGIRYNGVMHGFVSFYNILPKGRKAIRETARFVKQEWEY